ncbi:sodium-independent sulfate anion transporter-like isoform X3 [Biomphalaria glabrata]|uniref:Sodium-independent sulfate anion transporter-like isoform X3 n=1 Tax=Biomphalaria glabrata TaxID=6526 RepID=A0A9W2ZQG7_BIOGL|nr:sodium-independent sulfate anion transporter-like isoform X3 [Biomphalaria glabrata]
MTKKSKGNRTIPELLILNVLQAETALISWNTPSNGLVANGEPPWTTRDENVEVEVGGQSSTSKQVQAKVKKCCRETFTVQNVLSKFPIVKWLPKYRCDTFQSDIIAGLTVGLTVIPQGLAYAQVANLPPQYGLYSAFVGCFVYCVLGTSKDITLGPTAILSLMTSMFATSVSPELPSGGKDPTITILLTFFCGVIQLVLGILKLGILVNFISYPVINAFTSAAAITIGFGQIKNLLGLKKIPDDFLNMVYQTFKKLPETSIWDMTMGLISFVIVMLLKKLRDIKWSDANVSEIPISKIVLRKILWLVGTACNAIVVISAAGVVVILEDQGFNGTIAVTGHIKPGMPDVSFPKFEVDTGNVTLSTGQIFSRLGTGLAIVPLLAVVETMAIGKAFARINKYKIDPTQELIAIGVANIASSFFQSYPITGSFSRTAVNSQTGVRTPMGGVWTGGLVILALCLLTPWFYYIPKSALAAVIISAILPMIEYHTVVVLWKANKFDLVPYFITFLCSLLVGIEYGILIGVGISLLMILYPTARPKIKYSTNKGVLIVTPMQGLNFPAAEYIEIQAFERSVEAGKSKNIILNMENLTDVDYTVIQSLKTLLCDCSYHGMKLVLANGQPHVKKQIESADIKNLTIFTTLSEALEELVCQELQRVN